MHLAPRRDLCYLKVESAPTDWLSIIIICNDKSTKDFQPRRKVLASRTISIQHFLLGIGIVHLEK